MNAGPCAHGRQYPSMCPHCLGFSQGSISEHDSVHGEGSFERALRSITEPVQQLKSTGVPRSKYKKKKRKKKRGGRRSHRSSRR